MKIFSALHQEYNMAASITPPRKNKWKRELFLATVPFFIQLAARMLFYTCRITMIGRQNEDQFLQQGKPILFVSWHQCLLYYVYHFRNRNGIVMVSKSKDGELLARILNFLGFQAARGSSSLAGKEAMYQMISVINETKCSGGLVADAPRGPFGVAKMGIVKIARETGLPLIPVMCWAKRKILFRNWDRTLLPLPFTPIVFFYGTPISVPAEATEEEMEAIRMQLSDRLNRMLDEAREYFEETRKILVDVPPPLQSPEA